ncbi:hypothetical protein CSUI_005975 [Cystoisospora suis]|uniref:Uncharacterized protein n=1 Tax=Cystoisospora suis TaxID=483139 RepID=A0A2C6KV64_9APIC|nr:hypothetical protein CSUI_005975 [Cystoisospora suis]
MTRLDFLRSREKKKDDLSSSALLLPSLLVDGVNKRGRREGKNKEQDVSLDRCRGSPCRQLIKCPSTAIASPPVPRTRPLFTMIKPSSSSSSSLSSSLPSSLSSPLSSERNASDASVIDESVFLRRSRLSLDKTRMVI